jgi:hypothetical protein
MNRSERRAALRNPARYVAEFPVGDVPIVRVALLFLDFAKGLIRSGVPANRVLEGLLSAAVSQLKASTTEQPELRATALDKIRMYLESPAPVEAEPFL